MYIRDKPIHARQDAPSSDADAFMPNSDAEPRKSSHMPDPTSPASTTSIARATAPLSRKQFAEDNASSADGYLPSEPTSSSTSEYISSESSRRPRPTSSAPVTTSPVPSPPIESSKPSDISTQPPSSVESSTPSAAPTSSEPPSSPPPQVSSEAPPPPASSASTALPSPPPSAAPTPEPTPSADQPTSLSFDPVFTSLPATEWALSTSSLSSFIRSSVTLIALATTVKGPSTTYTSVTYGALATEAAERSSGHQLKGGAIAGVVIGVLAGLVLIGAIVFGWLRRRRDERMGDDDDYDFYGGNEKGANLKRSGTTHSALDFSDGPVSPHASWGPLSRSAPPVEPAWHGGAFLSVPGPGAGTTATTYTNVAGMSGPLSNIAAGGIGAGGLTAVGSAAAAGAAVGAVTTRSPAHSPTPTRGFEHDDPAELHARKPLQPATDGDMRLTAYDDWVTYNGQGSPNPNRATVMTNVTAPGVAGYGAGGGPYVVPDAPEDDGWEMVTPPSKAASQASHATGATTRTGETDGSGLTGAGGRSHKSTKSVSASQYQSHSHSQSQSQSQPYSNSQHSHSQLSHSSQRHPYAIEPPTATVAYGDIYDAYAPKGRLPWRG